MSTSRSVNLIAGLQYTIMKADTHTFRHTSNFKWAGIAAPPLILYSQLYSYVTTGGLTRLVDRETYRKQYHGLGEIIHF